MKRLLPLLLTVIGLFAQMPTTEYLYLDIYSDLTAGLPNRNPAYLASDKLPYAYAFKYSFSNLGGDYRLPFMPEAKHYNNLEVSAFQEMDNGLLFAGRFAYRYEQRNNKLWLHNAETNLDIPFYFGDSTSGDFNLNGIDWNIIFSYPLNKNLRAAVDLFYNVDEQFKSVFPKPNSKRNDFHIRPALSQKGKRSSIGITGSYFQYREEMETKRYSLEQGRTPIFMRIRGLDRPLLSFAETSEERLQTISGYGVSGNVDLGGRLLYEMNYEYAATDIADGGTEPVAQGSWDMDRFYQQVDLFIKAGRHVDVDLYFKQNQSKANGYHPDLNARIYQYAHRQFEGGVLLPFAPIAGEAWTNKISFAFEDVLREDNFFGLSHYIPWNTLNLGFDYKLMRRGVDYHLNFGYSKIIIGESIEYNEMSYRYYDAITSKEITYYATDREEMEAGIKITFPYRDLKIALFGTYKEVRPINNDMRFHETKISMELIF